MANHPYELQPDSAFWSRSVAQNFNPAELIKNDSKLLQKNDRVVSAGSCFASNLIPYIENAGITYVRTEKTPQIFSKLGENLGYANFSAFYGNIYTARQLLQLYKRALGTFKPIEGFWNIENKFVDPFRPGLKFPSSSIEEFELISEFHLKSTRRAFENASVFVFTFGLTEAWVSNEDGAVYPACPGTISGNFDPSKHSFKNFSVTEIIDDMKEFINLLREYNESIRFILSVSPVPLVATATDNHVLAATTYSKSVLRVAAEELSNTLSNVTYFPAFEIITGIQAPKSFFELDLRNVSQEGVDQVMQTLLTCSDLELNFAEKIFRKLGQYRSNANENRDAGRALSEKISTADCDEVMQDKNLSS